MAGNGIGKNGTAACAAAIHQIALAAPLLINSDKATVYLVGRTGDKVDGRSAISGRVDGIGNRVIGVAHDLGPGRDRIRALWRA